MIFQSFILGNLVSLCMKIINSVIVVELYYGFMTTFSIGPSYRFLLRARVMEEGEEGTEKKVSTTIGFIVSDSYVFILANRSNHDVYFSGILTDWNIIIMV